MAAVASRDNAQTFSDYLLFSSDILRLLVDFTILRVLLMCEPASHASHSASHASHSASHASHSASHASYAIKCASHAIYAS